MWVVRRLFNSIIQKKIVGSCRSGLWSTDEGRVGLRASFRIISYCEGILRNKEAKHNESQLIEQVEVRRLSILVIVNFHKLFYNTLGQSGPRSSLFWGSRLCHFLKPLPAFHDIFKPEILTSDLFFDAWCFILRHLHMRKYHVVQLRRWYLR